MEDTPRVRLAESDEDLEGILSLQSHYLEARLAPEEVAADGFLTVRHDLALLRRMHAEHPSVIATDRGRVVAYVLMMPKSFRDALPVLRPLFQVFDQVTYQGKALSAQRYFVNGQACVEREYRGRRLLDRIFALYREAYRDRFDLMLTEIARRNVRSMRAHERVGFRSLHSYVDPVTSEPWEVVAWDWREPRPLP